MKENIERKCQGPINSQNRPSLCEIPKKLTFSTLSPTTPPITRRGGRLRYHSSHHSGVPWLHGWQEMSHEIWRMIKEMKSWGKSEWKALTSTDQHFEADVTSEHQVVGKPIKILLGFSTTSIKAMRQNCCVNGEWDRRMNSRKIQSFFQ
jgi:hypothetical protein